MSLVRVKAKYQVTLPDGLRRQVQVGVGDVLEARVEKGKITLTPTLVMDRSKFPTADDEYTPAQRRAIDREIAKGLEDFKKGRFHGPFHSANEAIASIKATLKQRAAVKRAKRSR